MGFLTHAISVLIAVIAIAFTVFVNYPPPPESPILYQWRTSGKYYEFNGYDIFYKDEFGKGNELINATILCLHGFPTSSFDFYKVWPHLKKTFKRVIAVDFLGLGFSSKPRYHHYSVFEQSDLVENFLKHLGIREVHVWSHDYGDTVAQELIARQNEGKEKITLKSVSMMNGGIFPGIYRPFLVQKLLRFPIIGTILGKLANYYMFSTNIISVFGEETCPTVAELYDMWAIIRYNDGYRISGEILYYMDERHMNEDRWVGALKETKIKIHFIYGALDPINPESFVDFYKKIIPNPIIDVLRNCGHYPHLELPDIVFNLYQKFIRNHILS
ncbi:mesoderm-specific transcript protein-like protein [Dinothrombium tinctorium]|uniref:Mesoderm-specific transcript protein-like protein n=1 Tax=Dinothrombium tinctorium TaxID=1965070 RepID=A0A3S4RAL2_9ACAR|nr:mesoderm-specific transcript protein-like protein [Dinothrombium tinctorium]